MRETPEDIARLERLIESSHARAGAHLRSIFDDERRVAAADLPERLTGVQMLHLATATAAGEPRVSPVDGLLIHARWHFGTAPQAMRARHLLARPAVSASVAHGERFAIVVHGRAVPIDFDEPAHADARACFSETYGTGWEEFARPNRYFLIEPERVFTFGGVG
jgi:Pyridoxamine 5'-phosphate oxidase